MRTRTPNCIVSLDALFPVRGGATKAFAVFSVNKITLMMCRRPILLLYRESYLKLICIKSYADSTRNRIHAVKHYCVGFYFGGRLTWQVPWVLSDKLISVFPCCSSDNEKGYACTIYTSKWLSRNCTFRYFPPHPFPILSFPNWF
jgi:hypothetical protein